jgi:hypothetical protein
LPKALELDADRFLELLVLDEVALRILLAAQCPARAGVISARTRARTSSAAAAC